MSTVPVNNPNRVSSEVRESLVARVDSIRTRSLSIGLIAAVVWGIVVVLLAVLMAVWFDLLWDLPAAARVTAMQVAIGCGVVALMLVGWFGYQRSAAGRVARALDNAGLTGGEIVAGLNLAAKPNENSAVSAGLAEMAVARAAATAAGIPANAAAPVRPVSRASLALCGLAALFATIAWLMPGFFQTQWNRFASPHDDVPPFSLLTIAVEPGDAEIIYGEGIDIVATTNETPVDDLQLVLQYEDGRRETAPMFSGSENHWRSVLTRITEPFDYHVVSGRARSEKFRLSLITIPEIRSIEAIIQPPNYTRLAVTRGPIPTQGLSGLAGTRVTLRVTSNRPLSSGEIRISNGDQIQVVAMQPAGELSEIATGQFSITANGKFEVQVTDIDGQYSRQNTSGSIVLLADNRPFVRLTSPRQTSLATPTATVPVVVEAEDDYGISSLLLFRSLNDSVPNPRQLDLQGITTLHVDRSVLQLADYGLKPGDQIKLFARVEDNDPAGAKGSESPIHTIQIIAQEDFDSMQRQQQGIEAVMAKYRQVQRELEKLAEANRDLEEALKDLPKDATANSEATKNVADAAQAARDAAEQLRSKLQQKIPIDVDDEINDRLKAMAKELDEIAKELDALAKQAESGEISNKELQDAIAKLKQKMGQQQGDFGRQVMQPMNNMAQAFNLIRLENDFVQLVLRQRDLADRSASLKEFENGDDPDARRRLREYSEEQGELYEMLIDVLHQIEDGANQLPVEPEFDALRQSALDFARAVAESGADAEMEDAELAFADFSGLNGHQHAENAATILEKFLSQCSGMGDQAAGACKNCFSPSLGCPNPGNSLQQLAQMFGLGRGQGGMGAGSGGMGGYSQRRSTASNMGLYGNQPVLNETAESGRGDRESGADGSLYSSQNRDGDAGGQTIGTERTQGGTSAASVPAKYERRTGEYFRRLAEESGN